MAESLLDRVVFIIGAGHSLSANAPTTAELTAWILDGNGPLDRSNEALWSPARLQLLRDVRDHLRVSGNEPTYESIFTWLWTGYFSSDTTMYRTAWSSCDPFERIGLPRSDENSAYEALRVIEDGVWQALRDERLEVSKAPTLTVEAVDDPRVGSVSLVTLNHDRVLEALIGERPYDDGFGAPAGERAEWRAGRGEQRNWDNDTLTQLIKMHGSIDWWSPVGWGDGGYVLRDTEYPGKPFPRRPLFLVGSGPKLFQSSNLLFARQVVDAGLVLARATCVIVVGYGFGDVRVNSLWYGATIGAARETRTLPTVIVDPNRSAPEAVAKTKMNDALEKLLDNRHPDIVGRTVYYDERAATAVSWKECAEAVATLRG